MGDLAVDAAPRQVAERRFQLDLSREWEIWGPNGGYLVAAVLRAAGTATGRARPANVTVHFLAVASFDEPVVLDVEILRSTRVATSAQVRITQGDRLVLTALVWAIDADLPGLDHTHDPAPTVTSWRDHPTLAERFAAMAELPPQRYDFWNRFEQRPPEWIADWDHRPRLDPVYENWMRFAEQTNADDPWVRAGMLALLVDLGAWPAASRAHLRSDVMAPSIDVSCEFHRLDPPADPDADWLFLRGTSPFAGDGLIASHQEVRDDRGRLLASGISHLLCRILA
jgi:acyl-CoA thioesterase